MEQEHECFDLEQTLVNADVRVTAVRLLVWKTINTQTKGVFALAATGFATLWMAVFADVGVTVIAVLNAMRTLR